MITAYGDIDLAVRSLKEGAADFVIKPWHNEKLLDIDQRNIEEKEKTNQFYGEPAKMADSVIGKELIGESEVMQEIFLKIEKIAPTDANILISGRKRNR